MEVRKIRIFHINTINDTGGAAKVALRLNNGLLKKNYKSNILTRDIQQRVIISNIFDPALESFTESLDVQDIFKLFSFELLFNDIFRKADIVHLHNLHGNYFGLSSLPIMTKYKKFVWTLHDMWAITGHCAYSMECNKFINDKCEKCTYPKIYPSMKKDRANALFKIKNWIYKHSDFEIVVPSKWLESQVKRSILKDKSIHYIPNGIDINVFKPYDKLQVREKLGLPKDKAILLFSANKGSRNPWKGPQYLMNAIKEINRSEWRDKVLFLDIGGNSYRKDNYMAVKYIKNEALMAQYYSSADIYIFPTLADNAPLTVLEAMACGLPVVTFKTGGVPEIVTHLETGYVASYKDQKDFNEGLFLLINNEELRTNMSKKAIKTITQKFTLDIMINNYIKLYDRL